MASNSYRFTIKAENDLDEILGYLSLNLGNPSAAKSFYDELFSKIELICDFPQSCESVCNECVRREDVRKALVGNYTVYYVHEAKESVVIILRIVYGGRNLEEIIKFL